MIQLTMFDSVFSVAFGDRFTHPTYEILKLTLNGK